MRAIAIVGRRFSGSTILCRMLDLVPGVVAVGETDPLLRGAAACTTCGGACRYLTPQNFQGVSDRQLYPRIARVFGSDVIVTSDKRTKYLQRVTQPKTLDVLVVFKSPFAFAASDKRGHPRHQKRSGRPVFPILDVAASLQLVREYYRSILRWEHPRRKTFVSLDRFMVDHVTALRKVCVELELPVPKPVLSLQDTQHHFVLGNFDAMDAVKLSVDDRWIAELTAEEKLTVANAVKTQRLYDRLLKLSCV